MQFARFLADYDDMEHFSSAEGESELTEESLEQDEGMQQSAEKS